MRVRTGYFRSSSQLSPADLFGQYLRQSFTTTVFLTTPALLGLNPTSARRLRGAHPHLLLQHWKPDPSDFHRCRVGVRPLKGSLPPPPLKLIADFLQAAFTMTPFGDARGKESDR